MNRVGRARPGTCVRASAAPKVMIIFLVSARVRTLFNTLFDVGGGSYNTGRYHVVILFSSHYAFSASTRATDFVPKRPRPIIHISVRDSHNGRIMQNIPLIAAQILSRAESVCQCCSLRVRSGGELTSCTRPRRCRSPC